MSTQKPPSHEKILQDMTQLLDQTMLEKLQSGQSDAAFLNVCRQRLKDLNLDKIVTTDDPANRMAKIMAQRHGLKLTGTDDSGAIPPVDTADDDPGMRVK